MCFFLLIGVLDSGISIMIDGTFLNSNPSALGDDAFNFETCSSITQQKRFMEPRTYDNDLSTSGTASDAPDSEASYTRS
jgi:hypothetical protein